MSHDPNRPHQPQVQARRHAPALIAILVALAVAALAFLFFGAAEPPADDVTQIEVPQGGTAEGTDGSVTTPSVCLLYTSPSPRD